MVANGAEVGQQHHYSRRSSFVIDSPRRLSRNADSEYSPMEIPKLLQRGVSFKVSSPARYHQLHYSSAHSSRSSCHKRIWVTFLLCLGTFLGLYISFLRPSVSLSHDLQDPSYGVVVDISRQGVRINVFQVQDSETLVVEVLRNKPAPAPLGSKVTGVGYDVSSSLFGLLEHAKSTIPELERPQTRVYVVGTGGLEWIPAQNRDVLLEEFRKIVREVEFQFEDDWATVISGREEGVYEWVAANHAHGMVQSGSEKDTIGVLTLGDESAQVTFVSEEMPPPAYLHQIQLWGTTYNLYSYSFENLGLETASRSLLKLMHARAAMTSTDHLENQVVKDPCTPRGYRGPSHQEGLARADGDTGTTAPSHPTVPLGNFTACRAESLALLRQGQDACLDKNCPIGAIFVPELHGNFIATRKFYQTLKYFSLPAMASLADLAAAGETYCGQGGGVRKDLFPEYEEVRKPCFSAAFILAFLHDSLGFPVDGNKVMFTDVVNSVPVEWTLGFFLTRLLEEQVRSSPPVFISGELFGNTALFLGLLAIVGALLWFVTRWRSPPLKTIYDLEKGRYFTTAARGR